MDRRPLWTGLLLACSVALFGARFRGCEGGEARPEGRLPDSTGPCIVDDDCVAADMCVAFTCAGGACVESGVLVDDDGDRYAPSPCGDDCDDNNPTAFPGATEVCDGVDQDCDGVIDEDALGLRTQPVPRGLLSAHLVDLGERYVVVGLDLTGSLVAFIVDIDAAVGESVTVAEPLAAGVQVGAARDGDQIHVLVAEPGATPRTWELTAEPDGSLAVAPGRPLVSDTDIFALDFAVYGGQRWLLFDTRSGLRVLARDGGERVVLRPGETTPRLATDGRLVAATDGDDTVRFFSGDGSEVGSQTLPGRFAFRGLASGDGLVYAAYRDAFDHALTRVTPEAFTSPVTAPFGSSSEDVSIFYVAPRLMTIRADAGALLGAWLYDASLGVYEATYVGAALVPRAAVVAGASAATNSDGVSALYLTYSDPSPSNTISVLQCR